jgi:type VI secretion system secreted protein Hcp
MKMRSLVNLSTRTITVLVLVTMLGLFGLSWVFEQVDAPAPSASPVRYMAPVVVADDVLPSDIRPTYFAKYDGFDGESKDENHDKWIDILSIEWEAEQPTPGASGMSRRRGNAVVEDMVMTFEYEKAAPKLAEKCLKGEIIPKLEIELTATYGGARATYLRYELKNVMVTSYQVNGDAASGAPPTVTVANNFEEIKVTYTEYDDTGSSQGNVEFEWKVEKGE